MQTVDVKINRIHKIQARPEEHTKAKIIARAIVDIKRQIHETRDEFQGVIDPGPMLRVLYDDKHTLQKTARAFGILNLTKNYVLKFVNEASDEAFKRIFGGKK